MGPLFNKGAKFVTGKVHAIEVGQNFISLDILAHKFDLPVSIIFVLVQVRKTNFVDASFKRVTSDFQTLRFSAQSLTDISLGKHAWGTDSVPFFFKEWINYFLLPLFDFKILV